MIKPRKDGCNPVLLQALALAIVLLLALLSVADNSAAALPAGQALLTNCSTMIDGDVTVPTTWTLAASPHCVQPGVHVSNGVTLTVQPGVTIYFVSATSGLTVSGSLVAVGTPTQPITFTSYQANPQPGDWARLYVPAGGRMRLEYTDVSYGGSGKFTSSVTPECTNPLLSPPVGL